MITGLPILKEWIDSFVPFTIGEKTTGDLVVSVFVFFFVYLLFEIFRVVVLKRLAQLARKSSLVWDDVLISELGAIPRSFYFLLAFYAALLASSISQPIEIFVYYLVMVFLTYWSVKIFQGVLRHLTNNQIDNYMQEEKAQKESLKNLIGGALNTTLWVLAVLFLLSNFGFNISSLLAGLGIGGLAIALALQSVFGDIFATLSLYFDKPFKIGDFIIVGNDMGTVDYIGMKSTRIKTLQGQELVIPNKELTNARVNNYKRMEKRRVLFTFGVTYETSTAKLKKIPNIVAEIIKNTNGIQLDRVHFKEFGAYSLNFEVVYYVLNADYNFYMDKNQEIIYAMKEKFAHEKIEMAYPTQIIYRK